MLTPELKTALKTAETRNQWTPEMKNQQIKLVTEIVKRSKNNPHTIKQMILAYQGEPHSS
jgi:hypothetical protein